MKISIGACPIPLLRTMTINNEKTLAEQVRADFPILREKINDRLLVYLDTAETSQKPYQVLDALRDYYEQYNSNVHKGAHTLSDRATSDYAAAREKIAAFVNAFSHQEIVYTRNATEAINLVAYSWGMNNLSAGDEIILSVMEHDSNIIPWQLVAQKTGAVLKYVGLTPDEEFDLEHFKTLICERTKLVSVVHLSNALGCINPVEEIIALAHNCGAKVLIDACQSLPHIPIDVQKMDCDWLAGSGHKMCGPTGIGFLYGKLELLRSMPPFLGGGKMYADVFPDHATYADAPYKFEAGTPAIADAIALGVTVDYLNRLGMDRIAAADAELARYLFQQLQQIPEIRTYGPKPETARNGRVGISIFTPGDLDPDNLCTILDRSGVVINAGIHDTQLLHRLLGVKSTARVSLYFYNTRSEIDVFIAVLKEALTQKR
jgi:cysteine desulfurase/selenocysteine lyase